MGQSFVFNQVRRGFYLDSVALMRLSQEISALPGVERAAMMIGTESNKRVLEEAGLLAVEGRSAEVNDLVIALRAGSAEEGEFALAEAGSLLEAPSLRGGEAGGWSPKSLATALDALPGANLAMVSVPGEFAAEEARKAMKSGLHVMLFSDNVSVEEERLLKEEARSLGLLLMGPDCGTSLIGGVPLAFANEVPRGEVGIISASGTGLQEVSSLIARGGGGVSHGIGVGGRDLSEHVGGIMTLEAIEALDRNPETGRIVLISKPAPEEIARRIFERVGKSSKPFTICFLGLDVRGLPSNARSAATLTAAAEDALDSPVPADPSSERAARAAAAGLGPGRKWIRGLYAGGSLCAEAQVVLLEGGESLRSNVPVPGADPLSGEGDEGHSIVDLGADEFTVGRPHPMLDPSVRNEHLSRTVREAGVAAVLLDVVIGYGAHEDPAGVISETLSGIPAPRAPIVASVCGTEGDPQVYSEQVGKLKKAGVAVAPSNALAAVLALRIAQRNF